MEIRYLSTPKSAHKPGLRKAVSYRIPLQVTQFMLLAGGDAYPICPRCKRSVDREYMRFCDRCGQRLFWGSYDLSAVVRASGGHQRKR